MSYFKDVNDTDVCQCEDCESLSTIDNLDPIPPDTDSTTLKSSLSNVGICRRCGGYSYRILNLDGAKP